MYKTLTAALFLAGSFALPAHAATDYPWCQRTVVTNGTPDCSFTNVSQCQAAISGVGGDCIRNPRLAYGAMAPGDAPVRKPWRRSY